MTGAAAARHASINCAIRASASGLLRGDVIGVLPAYTVTEEIQSGTLRELCVQEPLPAVAIWLTTQRRPLESSPLLDLLQLFEEVLQDWEMPRDVRRVD